MLKVTVERETWLRGQGLNKSRLRNRDGNMCCLGFVCKAIGLSNEDIFDRACPSDVNRYRFSEDHNPLQAHNLTDQAGYSDTDDCNLAMHTNDDTVLDDSQREALLIMFMSTNHNIEMTFVDKIEDPNDKS